MKTQAFVAVVLSLFGGAVHSDAAVRFDGHWEGVLVATSAEQEINVVLEIVSNPHGGLQGKLWFPLSEPKSIEMREINVSGTHVSFSVQDENGVISKFEGEIDQDGSKISGRMTENGKTLPFSLQRMSNPPSSVEPDLRRLSRDAANLRVSFNKDEGHKRILMILNPGSYSSRMALSIVKRYALGQGPDADSLGLRLYVVWVIPDNNALAEQIARQSATLAIGENISHFVGDNSTVSGIFKPMLSVYGKVSNPSLLFSTRRTWTDVAPVPDKILQAQKVDGPSITGEKLNGLSLLLDLKNLE